MQSPAERSSRAGVDDRTALQGCRAPRPACTVSRPQALLATGLLALSALAPAAIAVAVEPDSERDGTAAPQGGAADPAVSPNYDPGGNAAQIPDAAPPPDADQPPQPGGDDQVAPVDQPANTDADDSVVDAGDGDPGSQHDAAAQTTNAAAGSAAAASPPPDVDAGGALPVVTGPATPAAVPVTEPKLPGAVVGGGHTLTVRQRPARQPTRRTHTRQVDIAASTASDASVTAPPRGATTAPAPSRGPGRRARRGDRTHIVLAGESLWAIASDLLGRDATDAQVAREVRRLWRLNRARIATGDPDLLYARTRLVLRYRTNKTTSAR